MNSSVYHGINAEHRLEYYTEIYIGPARLKKLCEELFEWLTNDIYNKGLVTFTSLKVNNITKRGVKPIFVNRSFAKDEGRKQYLLLVY